MRLCLFIYNIWTGLDVCFELKDNLTDSKVLITGENGWHLSHQFLSISYWSKQWLNFDDITASVQLNNNNYYQ